MGRPKIDLTGRKFGTAVAAMNLHKHFLGFEISDEHYATAVNRIEGLRGHPVQQVGGFDFNQGAE